MALQTGLFKVTGRLDNVIGYRRNGKHFLRSMPDKVRQTSATRRAAHRFGMASRKGKLIRQAFRPGLDMRYDGTVVNRLNKLLVESGPHNLEALQNFRFNRHTGIEKFFLLAPAFTADGALTIPAQELPGLGINNTHLQVTLIATRIDFTAHRVMHTHSDSAIIDLDQPFNGLQLNVPINGNGMLLVMLQCHTFTACNGELSPAGDRRYMAADVIRVVTPATPEPSRIAVSKKFSIPVLKANGFPSSIMGSSKASRAGRRSNLLPPVVKLE